MNSLILSLGLLALVVFLSWLAAKFAPRAGYPNYRSRGTLLSPAEQRFYDALRVALPPYVEICMKVRLADVIACRKGEFKQASLNKISSKHLDFVLVHRVNARILAAVELDDRSHARPDRIERDKFVDHALKSAGIQLVRVRAAASYDPSHLTATLVEALKPTA